MNNEDGELTIANFGWPSLLILKARNLSLAKLLHCGIECQNCCWGTSLERVAYWTAYFT